MSGLSFIIPDPEMSIIHGGSALDATDRVVPRLCLGDGLHSHSAVGIRGKGRVDCCTKSCKQQRSVRFPLE